MPVWQNGDGRASGIVQRRKRNKTKYGHLVGAIDLAAWLASRIGEKNSDLHHERLAETAKHPLPRFDVPGALGDIVVLFVNDNPALLKISHSGSLALDLRNLKRPPSGLGGCVVIA